MIVRQEDCEYSDIICEYSSTESKFTKNREYITLKNDFISHVMWIKVWVIQQEYHHLNLRKNLNSLVD